MEGPGPDRVFKVDDVQRTRDEEYGEAGKNRNRGEDKHVPTEVGACLEQQTAQQRTSRCTEAAHSRGSANGGGTRCLRIMCRHESKKDGLITYRNGSGDENE